MKDLCEMPLALMSRLDEILAGLDRAAATSVGKARIRTSPRRIEPVFAAIMRALSGANE